MDDGVVGPVMGRGSGARRADGKGGRQFQGLKDWIEDMATHIAKGARPEFEPLPPVSRMVILVADEGTHLGDPQPQVPIERIGRLVLALGARRTVPPLLAAP